MKKQDQRRIMLELLDSIQRKMGAALNAGDIPPEWDGIELRAWLKEIVIWECSGAVSELMRGKRGREFRNILATRNLA